MTLQDLMDGGEDWQALRTHDRGPEGALPITPEMLISQPSGNLFGLGTNAAVCAQNYVFRIDCLTATMPRWCFVA